jgi:hypothetical protein
MTTVAVAVIYVKGAQSAGDLWRKGYDSAAISTIYRQCCLTSAPGIAERWPHINATGTVENGIAF